MLRQRLRQLRQPQVHQRSKQRLQASRRHQALARRQLRQIANSHANPNANASEASISGPSTIPGVWILYINGQLPTAAQSTQITWSSGGLSGGERTPSNQLGPPTAPNGSWVIDANSAAKTAPGHLYTLTAMYHGVSTLVYGYGLLIVDRASYRPSLFLLILNIYTQYH